MDQGQGVFDHSDQQRRWMNSSRRAGELLTGPAPVFSLLICCYFIRHLCMPVEAGGGKLACQKRRCRAPLAHPLRLRYQKSRLFLLYLFPRPKEQFQEINYNSMGHAWPLYNAHSRLTRKGKKRRKEMLRTRVRIETMKLQKPNANPCSTL